MGPRVLVIPSNREGQLVEFLRAWEGKGGWTDVVVIEDNPEKTFHLPPYCKHFSHNEIRDDMGGRSWVISQKDSACRCYGFLVAHRMGAADVVTLDDDVRPPEWTSETPSWNLMARHRAFMDGHDRWLPSAGRRTRGLPYHNKGRLPWVVMNVGLWEAFADLDAVQALSAGDVARVGNFTPPETSWVIPRGQYAPICGMNLYACYVALPLLYFPLMGEGQPYRRFDDIWMGVIAKKVCDHLGWSISVGPPHVRHLRASDPFVNLVKEAPGIAANEHFWEIVDGINLGSVRSAPECMREIGHELQVAEAVEHVDRDYVGRLGEALVVWADLFEERK